MTIEIDRFIKENYDNCSECNRKFTKDEDVIFGYSKENKLMSVGSCCEKLLHKKHLKRFYSERLYKIPNHDNVLWKFMDLPKFVAMLKTKSIFFTRADKFSDPFEGAKGLLKNKKDWDEHYLNFFIDASKKLSKKDRSEQEINDEALRNLESLARQGIESKRKTGVSCWHENAFESEAMWKLYTSLDYGIAIKTTYNRLYDALGANPNIDIGQINYIILTKHFLICLNPFGISENLLHTKMKFER